MPKTFQVVPQSGNTQFKVIIILIITRVGSYNADVVHSHCQHNTADNRNESAHIRDQTAVQHAMCTRHSSISCTRNVKNTASVHEDF